MIEASVLTKLRNEKNVSLEKLAAKAGLSSNSLWKWEQKRVTPTLENFQRVLDVMGYELKIEKKPEN